MKYTRHGYSHKRLYGIWKGMLRRCLNSCASNFSKYGGRGITVCLDWREFIPFKTWALANGYYDDLTLDRRDNDGDYSPDNCRWSTQIEQLRNTSRNVRLTAFGETKLQKDWINDERCLASAATFIGRIKEGWTVEQALTIPPLKKGKGALSYKAKSLALRELPLETGLSTIFAELKGAK